MKRCGVDLEVKAHKTERQILVSPRIVSQNLVARAARPHAKSQSYLCTCEFDNDVLRPDFNVKPNPSPKRQPQLTLYARGNERVRKRKACQR